MSKYLFLGNEEDAIPELIVERRTSNYLIKQLNDSASLFSKKMSKGNALIYSFLFSFLGFFLIGVKILGDSYPEDDSNFLNGYYNDKVSFIIGLALIFISLVLLVILFVFLILDKKNRNKKINEYLNESKKITDRIFQELQIPDDYLAIDILLGIGDSNAVDNFILDENYCFVNSHNLYIATLLSVIKIPIDCIISIKPSTDYLYVVGWNKELPIEYYLKSDSGVKLVKKKLMVKYYIITVNIDNTEYEFYIPKYEFEQFNKLINN